MSEREPEIIATRVAPAGDDQMRNRAFRRHQADRHMWRRLKEDRNQHYEDLACPCWTDLKAMARFKEQPQRCSCHACGNQRQHHGAPVSELRRLKLPD